MKHSLFIAFFLCLGSFASAQQLTSPDGNLSLEFMEQADGVPAYRLDYKGNPVLTSGRLGLLTEEADLTEDSNKQTLNVLLLITTGIPFGVSTTGYGIIITK